MGRIDFLGNWNDCPDCGTLLAGCLLLKAAGLGIYALVSARGRGHRRGKRASEDLPLDEIDQEVLQKETETIFRHLDETDPAHCFRRYICDLSTGKLEDVTDDHMAILNLVARPIAVKTKAFEYRIAASVGQTFARLDVCEELYECPLAGKDIDKLFN